MCNQNTPPLCMTSSIGNMYLLNVKPMKEHNQLKILLTPYPKLCGLGRWLSVFKLMGNKETKNKDLRSWFNLLTRRWQKYPPRLDDWGRWRHSGHWCKVMWGRHHWLGLPLRFSACRCCCRTVGSPPPTWRPDPKVETSCWCSRVRTAGRSHRQSSPRSGCTHRLPGSCMTLGRRSRSGGHPTPDTQQVLQWMKMSLVMRWKCSIERVNF